MFACINVENNIVGIGPTLQKAWKSAQNAGLYESQFEGCDFYELPEPLEVERMIVPVTKVIQQKTNKSTKRK